MKKPWMILVLIAVIAALFFLLRTRNPPTRTTGFANRNSFRERLECSCWPAELKAVSTSHPDQFRAEEYRPRRSRLRRRLTQSGVEFNR